MFKHATEARQESEEKRAACHKNAIEQVRNIIEKAISEGKTKAVSYLNMSPDDSEYCLQMLRESGYAGQIRSDQRDGSGYTFTIDWSKAE